MMRPESGSRELGRRLEMGQGAGWGRGGDKVHLDGADGYAKW